MKKYARKCAKMGIGLGVLLGSFLIVYAAMRLFYSQSVRSDLPRKQVFEFELISEIHSEEVGPGDEVMVEPVIINTATEPMYVFIEVDTPEYDGQPLYELQANEDWTLVESGSDYYVYGYGHDQMRKLMPKESTEALTSQLKMIEISNANLYYIDDISFTITGYGIDTENPVSDMQTVWEECKELR